MKSRFLNLCLVAAMAAPALHAQRLRDVPTHYIGDSGAAQALAGKSAKPLSLASADFDEDGTPDLASGYAIGGAGAVAIHRGNVDALWPYGAALRNGTPPEFLPDAHVFAVPEEPDFLGAGDFDADGHWDIVTAKLGGNALYLLRGDGHGGFKAAERIALPGTVTAFTAGEINRLDGLTDLAVGIAGTTGPQVLVFESPAGALRGTPETLSIPAAATSLAMAALDDSGMNSLAVSAGNNLIVFHGRDRRLSHTAKVRDAVPAAEVTRQSFPFGLRALVAGRFTGNLPGLAALGDDGRVHFFERPDAEYQAARANLPFAIANPAGGPAQGRSAVTARAGDLPARPRIKEMTARGEVTLPLPAGIAAKLTAARTSTGQLDDLVALDGAAGQIHFVSRAAAPESAGRAMRLSSSLDIPAGAPAAVLPMRLRPGAIHSLVVLPAGQTRPVVAHANPDPVFTVTTTADSGPEGASLNSTVTPGSLRTAISNATNATGPTTIVFNLPVSDPNYNPHTGVFTFRPLPNTNCGGIAVCQGLPPLPPNCTLDGYTQPGGTLDGITQPAASPNTLAGGDNAILKIAIDGSLAGQGPSGIWLFNGSSTVRGLIITGFTSFLIPGSDQVGGYGVNVDSDSNFVEGNFAGVDYTGAATNGNNIGIGGFGGGGGNTIGGTTPQARNLTAGNTFSNYAAAIITTPGTYTIQGNYAGVDRTGKISLGGVSGINATSQSVIVGGTAAGAGNLLSGMPGNVGVSIQPPVGDTFSPDNNLVQGNIIGPDVTGAAVVGGGTNSNGVDISLGSMNLIGGTTPAARNIISGNAADGIQAFNAPDQSTIQGNFIGLDITGTAALGNGRDGIDQSISGNTANAVQTLVGGETPGAANVISNNGGNGIEFGGQTQDEFGKTGNTVLGNLIGTDVTGAANMGNHGAGITIDQGGSYEVIGATDTLAANTVAFNGGDGIHIDPAFGNIYSGIPLGINSVTNNLIFSNGGAGVRVISGTGNSISQNSIFANAMLGIDIDTAGPLINSNCNTAAGGANNLQNAPVLTPAASGGATLVSATATDPSGNTSEFSNCALMAFSGSNLNIAGSLNSLANTTYAIQFFANQSCDLSGFGQGKTFLNAISVTTNAGCIANFGDQTDPTKADLSVVVDFPHASESAATDINSPYTYLVRVTNNGAATATGVTLSDPLPGKVTYNSAITTQGSCAAAGNNVTCGLGNLAPGATATATIKVTVNDVGTIANTATVSSGTTDPNLANNSSTLNISSSYEGAFVDHFSPASTIAGTGLPFTLTIVGETFYNGVTTVMLNGSPIGYTFLGNQSCGGGGTCQALSITVSAALTVSPGTLTVALANPSPGGGGDSGNFTVFANPGSATQFLLSGVPDPAAQGSAYNLTVTAANAGGQTVPGYLGLVNLTGMFIGSTTFSPPSPYQFTAGDNGVHVFSVTPTIPGAETITVTDAGSPGIAGSLSFTVTPTLGPPFRIIPGFTPDPVAIGFSFQPLTVTITDATGNLLPGINITFTAPASGASGTFPNGQTTYNVLTDANGNASTILTANQTVGTFYEVDATAGSLVAQWFLSNTDDVPAHLVIHVGNNQSTPLNTQFRFSLGVIVTDAANNPLQFIPVTFAAQSNNGATAVLSVTSGVSERLVDPVPGLAFIDPAPFANGVAGTYTITASVGSLTATFTETNTSTPNPVASISFASGGGQSTPVNAPFPSPLQVIAFDMDGNLLSNVPITFSPPSSGAGAVLSAANVNTDAATGRASVTATANATKGSYSITASSGGFSDQITLTNTVGTNNIIAATGGTPQTTTVNTVFPTMLQVTLTDPSGNPLNGQTVTFSAPSSVASAKLSSPTAITNALGIASVQATANAVTGSYMVTASAAASTGSQTQVTATFSLTNAAPVPGSVVATAGTPQKSAVNTGFTSALQVTVRDTGGSPMTGVLVSFTAPSAGASAALSSPTATTNGSGIASVTATANTVVGSYSVTAAVGSLSATFALGNTPGPPASITATGGTPQSPPLGTALTTALQATVKDAFGNVVPGVSVTFTPPGSGAGGAFTGLATVTTNSAGIATAPTFTANSTPGAYQVTAAAGSLNTTFNLTNVTATPANIVVLAGNSQSATVNTAFATAFKVEITDSSHNPIQGVTVTFTPPTSGASGAFAGSASLTTDAGGTVTAPAFTANTIPGSYSVAVAAGSLNTSLSLTNNAGPPSLMTIAAGNNQSSARGVAFATALAVKITDSFSNPLGGIAVTFTPPASGAGGTFAGSATVNTGVNGIATASAFTANSTAGGYQVTAAAGNLSVAFNLTNLTGAPANIAVLAGSPQSTTVQTAFATAFEVQITDSSHNPIQGATVTFTPPGSGASGSFTGSNSVTTDVTGTVTATVFTANTTAGAYNVTVASGSLNTKISLTNAAGPPSLMTITAGNNQSAPEGIAFTTALAVKVTDAFSNPLGGIAVTFKPPASGAGGTFAGPAIVNTGVNGIATAPKFTANSTPGAYQLTATAGGLSATFSLTNLTGAPANITVLQGSPQSATVDTAFATSFEVQITDSSHNPIQGATVTFTPPGSGASGSFSGSGSVTTDASGTVTAPIFTANTKAGSYRVTAASGSLSTTLSLTNTPGAPSLMTIAAGNNQTAALSTAFATALAVKITDAFSNPIGGIAVTFTPPASGSGGAFTGSATVNTNSSGIATAPPFTANGTAGTYQVAAAAGSLSATFNLTNTAGPPPLIAMPASLQFSVPGCTSAAPAQTLTVSVSGSALQYRAQTNAPWLKATPASGSVSSGTALSVSVNPAGLGQGLYPTNLVVSAPPASPAVVPVTLMVGSANALVVSPSSLPISAPAGVAAAPVNLSVTSPCGSLGFTAQSDQPWLSVGAPGTTPAQLAITADATTLNPGTYPGHVTLLSNDAANNPVTIEVTFTVSAAAPVVMGIVNSASFAPGPLAGGTLFSLFGNNLATSTAQAGMLPLPENLGGISITIDSIAAPLLYASAGQINAQVPYGIASGVTQMVLTIGGISYPPIAFQIANVSPGLFIIPNTGGRAAVENQDFSVNSPQNPAAPGSMIMAYFTGEGAVTPVVATGAAAPLSPLSNAVASSSATIGGQTVQVSFTGLTPTLAGLGQMNITVPNLAPGTYSLILTVGGADTNAGQISIGP